MVENRAERWLTNFAKVGGVLTPIMIGVIGWQFNAQQARLSNVESLINLITHEQLEKKRMAIHLFLQMVEEEQIPPRMIPVFLDYSSKHGRKFFLEIARGFDGVLENSDDKGEIIDYASQMRTKIFISAKLGAGDLEFFEGRFLVQPVEGRYLEPIADADAIPSSKNELIYFREEDERYAGAIKESMRAFIPDLSLRKSENRVESVEHYVLALASEPNMPPSDVDPGVQPDSEPAGQTVQAPPEETAAMAVVTRIRDTVDLLEEGKQLARAKDFDGAAESYNQVLETDPDNAKALHYKAYALYRREKDQPNPDLTEALEASRRAIVIDPSSFLNHLNHAKILCKMGDEAGARETVAVLQSDFAFNYDKLDDGEFRTLCAGVL